MKPYYQHAGVTIYHGDCREILPEIGAVDVVLTDPPWPVSKEVVAGNLRAAELWREVSALLEAERVLVWLPCNVDPRSYLCHLGRYPYLRFVYVRRAIPGYYGRVLMDGEVIHVLGTHPPARKGRMVIPGGMEITYERSDRSGGHPAPRSRAVAEFLVKWWSDADDVVLDPFSGSGTTLVAAKLLNRKAIGIEVEERYCELAANRLAQEVFQFEGPCL